MTSYGCLLSIESRKKEHMYKGRRRGVAYKFLDKRAVSQSLHGREVVAVAYVVVSYLLCNKTEDANKDEFLGEDS